MKEHYPKESAVMVGLLESSIRILDRMKIIVTGSKPLDPLYK